MKIERQDFNTEIPELIGKKIEFLKVSGLIEKDFFQPTVFWMNIGTQDWYRFFIDSRFLQWFTFCQSEMKELIEEDFDEDEYLKIRDLKKELDLDEEKIVSIHMIQSEIDGFYCGQLTIRLDHGKGIIFREYDDEKEEELILIKN